MSKYPGRVVSNLVDAGYSVYFDGTDDLLYTNGSMSFTGQFACEAWFYRTLSGGSQRTIFALNQSVNNGFGSIRIDTDNANTALNITASIGTSGSAWAATISFNSAYTVNQWTHVLVTRDSSNVVRLFINGILRGNVTVSGTLYNALNNHIIGANYITGPTSANQFQGYISNVRVINGSIPTEYQTSSVTGGTVVFNAPNQLFNVTNTAYLTCNSPALVDQSSNAFTITTPLVGTNAPVISSFTPFPAYVPYNPALGASTPGVWTLDEAMQAKATRRWNMYDPSFNQTTLLLHGNGANNAQNNTFLDSSSNNFTITRNPASGPNAPTQGSFSPFSQTGWSNHFGSSTSNLKFASDAAFAVGNSNFTVECFVNFTAWASTNQRIFVQGQSGTDNLTIQRDSGANNLVVNIQGSSSISYAWSPNIGQWYHIAVVKSGTGTGQVAVYIDGLSVATGTSSTSISQNQVLIGGIDWASGYNMQGYISNLRYTIGAALYTGNFTPSTAPLTTTSQGATASQVEILTCQSNRFVDNSTNGFAITVNGTTSVQPFSPFYPTAAYTPATVGGSGYFDGSGDYLSYTGTNLNLGTGAFTVEGWIYQTVRGYAALISTWTSNAGTGFSLSVDNTGLPEFYMGNGSSGANYTLVKGATAIPLNAWVHMAGTKAAGSGGTMTLYVNGVSVGTPTASTRSLDQTAAVLGRYYTNAAGNELTGYLSSVRVSNTVRTITVPTAPYTSDANTLGLFNFTNAGIFDSTAKNVLETVGNAQISTTQSKFGGTSMYFDGTGDYLQTAPSQLFNVGASDFTIEFWIYPTSFSVTSYPLYSALARAKADCLAFETNTSGVLNVYVTASGGAAWSIISAGNIGTLTLNAWNHVAFVRNGPQFRGYLNGVQSGLTTSSTSSIASFDGWNIGYNGVSGNMTGYLDDIRITRSARYIANFTPQTSQWQDE